MMYTFELWLGREWWGAGKELEERDQKDGGVDSNSCSGYIIGFSFSCS